jgi:hypothetical protein
VDGCSEDGSYEQNLNECPQALLAGFDADVGVVAPVADS